jgi:hypothetical protein
MHVEIPKETRTFPHQHNQQMFEVVRTSDHEIESYTVHYRDAFATIVKCYDSGDWLVYGARLFGFTYPTYRDALESVCNALIARYGRK